MLRYTNQLLFPTLKLISIQNDIKNNLYQLDWTDVDTLKKEKWLKTHQLTSDQFFQGTIPVFLKAWVDDMQFAIPQGILDEIRHCSLKAEEEWGRRKPETRWEPIPTRGPAISYVQSAFTLLADCLFDPETNNFSRDSRKILVPCILIHRFWSYQTKPDNLMLYTGFQDLKKYYEDKQITDTYFLNFIGSLENHINSLQDKNEKAPNKIIPNASLKDVLENKRASALLKNITILKILHLLRPKIIRSSTGFLLTAEFEGDLKLAPSIMDSNHNFTFFIKEENYIVVAHGARIRNIGGTPPPTITIDIDNLEIQKPDRPFLKVVKDPDESVKKVDVNRIKEVRDNDLKANQDFKEIDIKSGLSNAENAVYLRHHK